MLPASVPDRDPADPGLDAPERRRIGHELRAVVAQPLAAVMLELDRLRPDRGTFDPQKADDVQRRISDALAQAQSLAQQLVDDGHLPENGRSIAHRAGAHHRSSPARVAVVDDQSLFRSGLVELLGHAVGITVVGSAGGGDDAVELCRRTNPDVVLMDVNLSGLANFDGLRAIVAACPTTRVVVLTALASDESLLSALEAGASGYVLKDAEFDAIVAGVHAVHQGEQVLSSAVARRLTGLAMPHDAPPADQLTRRELEILRLIAQGEPNRSIASRLSISDKTVRNHVSHLYDKLAISTRSEAVLCAVRRGLVEL